MSDNPNTRQFVPIFDRHYNTIKEMTEEDGNKILRAITEYGFSGVLPDFCGVCKIVWTAIYPDLERNRALSLGGQKGGQTGGKATKRNNPNGRRAKNHAEEATDTAGENPPTLDEVRQYAATNAPNVDAENFYNYYTSNGWMAGNTKIRNWKAKLRQWQQREQKATTATADGLGVGEYRNQKGRTYGMSGVIVPDDAPPRPSEAHYWSETTSQWEKSI